jgi:hypothetical protein
MFSFCSHEARFPKQICQAEPMPDLTFIRTEIERMRVQVSRQRKEILALQKAGINSLPAEALLARMLANIDNMCAERDRLKREQPTNGKVLGGQNW